MRIEKQVKRGDFMFECTFKFNESKIDTFTCRSYVRFYICICSKPYTFLDVFMPSNLVMTLFCVTSYLSVK